MSAQWSHSPTAESQNLHSSRTFAPRSSTLTESGGADGHSVAVNTSCRKGTPVLVVRLYPTLRRTASSAPSETHTWMSSPHVMLRAGGGGPASTVCFWRGVATTPPAAPSARWHRAALCRRVELCRRQVRFGVVHCWLVFCGTPELFCSQAGGLADAGTAARRRHRVRSDVLW